MPATVTPRRLLLPLLLALAVAALTLINGPIARMWLADGGEPACEQLAQKDWPDSDALAAPASAEPEDIDSGLELTALASFPPAIAAAVLSAALPIIAPGPRFPTGPPGRA